MESIMANITASIMGLRMQMQRSFTKMQNAIIWRKIFVRICRNKILMKIRESKSVRELILYAFYIADIRIDHQRVVGVVNDESGF